MKTPFYFALILTVIGIQSSFALESKPYQLPNEIYDGYWLMTPPKDQPMVSIVSFRQSDNGMIITQKVDFRCLSHGRYQQLDSSINTLTPEGDKMAMTDLKTKEKFSYLQVVSLIPKQSLTLRQSFDDEILSVAFPYGMLFNYAHTPTASPSCQF